jgi:hypothetical protein
MIGENIANLVTTELKCIAPFVCGGLARAISDFVEEKDD